MNVWTVANQKGGVGKTTTAVTLASLLARRSHRAVLVDLDPHASASAWLLGGRAADVPGVAELFSAADGDAPADLQALLQPLEQPGLSLLPASAALAGLERRLAARARMGCVLQQALAGLAPNVSHVIVDCPPTLGLLMINALAAADRVLVPVQTEQLALHGLERMLETLAMVERSQRRAIACTVVPTLHDPRTRAARDALARLREWGPRGLWDGVVSADTRLRDATRAGRPAPVHCPGARGVLAYDRLLDELLAQAPATVAEAV